MTKSLRNGILILLSSLLVFSVCAFFMPNTVNAQTGHDHCICGAIHNSVGDHTDEQNIQWQEFPKTYYDSGSWSYNLTDLPSGYYYLTKDMEVGHTLYIGSSVNRNAQVTICLNGHSMRKSVTHSSASTFDVLNIEVAYSSSLTITDCQEDCGKIYAGKGETILYKENGGAEFNIKTMAADTPVKAVAKGGAIYVAGGSKFVMYNGAIKDNFVDGRREEFVSRNPSANIVSYDMMGGAIYLNGSAEFEMYGGEISGNKAMALDIGMDSTAPTSYSQGVGSAIYANGDANISIYGGEIKNNIAGGVASGILTPSTYGSVISAHGGTVNISGGKIYDNIINDYNSGEYYQTATVYAKDVNITGGQITDNTTNFAVAASGTAVIGGGIIEGKNSDYFSGAVLVSGDANYTSNSIESNLYLYGSPKISGVNTDVALVHFTQQAYEFFSYVHASYNGSAYVGETIRLDFAYGVNDNGGMVFGLQSEEDISKFVPANPSEFYLVPYENSTDGLFLSSQKTQNTITWLDENGNVLSGEDFITTIYHKGIINEFPTITPEDENVKFAGWYYKYDGDIGYKGDLAQAGKTKFSSSPTFKAATYYDFVEQTDESGNKYYPITSAQDLHNLALIFNGKVDTAKYANKEFRLTNNVDLSTLCGETVGSWMPIGANSSAFSGTFDGQNYTISNLYFNDSEWANAGLFGSASGTIKNVNVDTAYIVASDYVGSIAGLINGEALNCTLSGSTSNSLIKGKQDVGGLFGATIGYICNCSNLGVPVDGNFYVGGVVGAHDGYSIITGCNNSGSVTGDFVVGGIVGEERKSIENCKNTGSVTAGQMVGGICGAIQKTNSGNSITNCVNNAQVIGNALVGGICGVSGAPMEKCTTMGLVQEAGQEKTTVSGYSKSTITDSNAFAKNTFTITYVNVYDEFIAEQIVDAETLVNGGFLTPVEFDIGENNVIVGYYYIPEEYGIDEFYLSDVEEWDVDESIVQGDMKMYVLIEGKNLELTANGQTKYYGKLSTAFHYARIYSDEGYYSEIKVISDYTEDPVLSLWGTDNLITVDLNGKTISFPDIEFGFSDEYYNYSTIAGVGYVLLESGYIHLTDSSSEQTGRLNAIVINNQSRGLLVSGGNYVSVVSLFSPAYFAGGTFSGLTQEQYYEIISINDSESLLGSVVFALGTNSIGLTVSPITQDDVDNAYENNYQDLGDLYQYIVSAGYVNSVKNATVEGKAFDKDLGMLNYYYDGQFIQLETIDVSSLAGLPDGLFFIEVMPAGTSVVDSFTVKFNTFNEVDVETQNVIDGGNAIRPDGIEKGDYEIVGWCLDEYLLQEFDFNTPITENIELYAVWSVKQEIAYFRVGDIYYNDVPKALERAIITGQPLCLVSGRNVEFSDPTTIPEGITLTLCVEENSSLRFVGDSENAALIVDGNLTIQGEGDIWIKGNGIQVNGTLNIESGNFVYDEEINVITVDDHGNVSVYGGTFSSEIPSECIADGYVVTTSDNQAFEVVSLQDYRGIAKEGLLSAYVDYVNDDGYNDYAKIAFGEILAFANTEIDNAQSKTEVDIAVQTCLQKFGKILTSEQQAIAVAEAMLEIEQYAQENDISLEEETLSQQIELFETKITNEDILAQKQVVLDEIDRLVEEREQNQTPPDIDEPNNGAGSGGTGEDTEQGGTGEDPEQGGTGEDPEQGGTGEDPEQGGTGEDPEQGEASGNPDSEYSPNEDNSEKEEQNNQKEKSLFEQIIELLLKLIDLFKQMFGEVFEILSSKAKQGLGLV